LNTLALIARNRVVLTLIIVLSPATLLAQEPGGRQRVQLASRDGDLQRSSVRDGRGSRHTHEPAMAAATMAASDPYGFAAILNGYRARAGLPPVAYDPNLSAWASQNNAAQAHRGIGHHVMAGCLQNCGWNYSNAAEVAQGWMHSPGHRANMLAPSITRFGIAYGPGPYWTLNAR
jgi:hypothetical protein